MARKAGDHRYQRRSNGAISGGSISWQQHRQYRRRNMAAAAWHVSATLAASKIIIARAGEKT